jgi:hypothetical protein
VVLGLLAGRRLLARDAARAEVALDLEGNALLAARDYARVAEDAN